MKGLKKANPQARRKFLRSAFDYNERSALLAQNSRLLQHGSRTETLRAGRINQRLNAVSFFEKLRKGEITGCPQNAKSFAEKFMTDPELKPWRPSAERYLRNLGYGAFLRRPNGLRMALAKYYDEAKKVKSEL